ncbi:hypothetical protein [Spiroplasma poulsonii]|uniref:hypothetical protein n=1 Tax=Spiroplasma poulsonii TaxID=2138 RepID=UPI001F4CAA9E|nr:hypothetical protein [Spiroplasma poulsonii]UNF62298.1 hypothetical protein MNU24_02215 [Spiroplasma poulsonii]
MIILMVKLLLLMLPKLNPTLKETKTILFLVKKKPHDQNTSNYRTKETKKLLQQVFRSEKTWLCFI